MDTNDRERVEAYRVVWDLDNHNGGLVLVLQKDRVFHRIHAPAQLQMLVDLLRNEQPIFYDHRRKLLQTADEPVGEYDG